MDNRNGNINKAQLLSCLKQVRDQLHDQAPLIHCITHPLVVNDCANAVLALGGRPIMAEHPAEVADISASAAALTVSLGNITDARAESMLLAGKAIKRMKDAENTKKVMTEYEGDVLVCAHTHIPFTKKFNNKTLINVGSVGKPKIGKPNPTYTIIEIKDNGEIVVQVRYLEYEYKRIMKDCTMLNFPTAITSSYETGKES